MPINDAQYHIHVTKIAAAAADSSRSVGGFRFARDASGRSEDGRQFRCDLIGADVRILIQLFFSR